MALSKDHKTILPTKTVAGNSSTVLSDCSPVDLSIDPTLAMTVKVTFDASATKDVRIHLRSSYDDTNYDTVDIGASNQGYFNVPVNAGNTVQMTVNEWTDPKYFKVIVENLDSNPADVTIIATTQEVSATA